MRPCPTVPDREPKSRAGALRSKRLALPVVRQSGAASASGRKHQPKPSTNMRLNTATATVATTAKRPARVPATTKANHFKRWLRKSASSRARAVATPAAAETPAVAAPRPSRSIEVSEPLPSERESRSALDLYLREVGQVDLITPAKEIELAARIKRGDEAARELMIKANLRLVVKIAKDYEHIGLPLLDLINEGNIGLMKAVERFDPAKGAKLSTYSSWWIRQQIRRALADQSKTIRLPVHVVDKIYHLGQAEMRLREAFGRDATDEELAEELEIAPSRVAELRTASIRPASLDAPLGDDDTSRLSDVVRDDNAESPYAQAEERADLSLLRELLPKLPRREEIILRHRFGLDGKNERTLEEIGDKLGLTRERIRQLQTIALNRLRKMMEQRDSMKLAA
jgi:RNA polymerase primary sigma factor